MNRSTIELENEFGTRRKIVFLYLLSVVRNNDMFNVLLHCVLIAPVIFAMCDVEGCLSNVIGSDRMTFICFTTEN